MISKRISNTRCTFINTASEMQRFFGQFKERIYVVLFKNIKFCNSWVEYVLKIPKLYWNF